MTKRDVRVWVLGQLKSRQNPVNVDWNLEPYQEKLSEIVEIAHAEVCKTHFQLQSNAKVNAAIQQALAEASILKGQWKVAREDDSEPIIFTEEELQCELAASLFLRWKMAQRPDVQSLRAKMPRLLTEKETYELLTNPLAGLLTFEHLSSLGVSCINLCGALVNIQCQAEQTPLLLAEIEDDEFRESMMPAINEMRLMSALDGRWPSHIMAFSVEVSSPSGQKHQIDVSHNSASLIRLVFGEPSTGVIQVQHQATHSILFPDPFNSEEAHPVAGYKNSIIGEVLTLARELQKGYWWEPIATAAALLTGNVPPIRTCFGNAGTYQFDDPQLYAEETNDPFQRDRNFEARRQNTDTAQGPAYLVIQPWTTTATLSRAWSAIVRHFDGQTNARVRLRDIDTTRHFCNVLSDDPSKEIVRDQHFERVLATVFPKYQEKRRGPGVLPPKKKRGRPKTITPA